MAKTPQLPNQSLTFAQLRPQFGEKIQLEIRGPSKRFSMQLVGYVPHKSVIVHAASGYASLAKFMTEQRQVTARLMTGNFIVAFSTQVLKLDESPLEYLHLRYPEAIEVRRVRQHNRVPVDLLVSVDVEDETAPSDLFWPLSALCTDISLNGLCIESPDPLGKKGDCRYVTVNLSVDNLEYALLLKCRLKNLEPVAAINGHDDEPERYRHGFEFEPMTDDVKLVVTGFVYQQFLVETGHLSRMGSESR
ncbi:MAG: flagellar brake protein [Pontibacterium sp.]